MLARRSDPGSSNRESFAVLHSWLAVAVAVSAERGLKRVASFAIVLVFIYTTILNIVERPEGMLPTTEALALASLCRRAEDSHLAARIAGADRADALGKDRNPYRAGYAQFTALWDVSLRVEAGEAVAVVDEGRVARVEMVVCSECRTLRLDPDERCGGTFENIDDVIPPKERADFMAGYKSAAGFAIESLNRAPPTIPPGAQAPGNAPARPGTT